MKENKKSEVRKNTNIFSLSLGKFKTLDKRIKIIIIAGILFLLLIILLVIFLFGFKAWQSMQDDTEAYLDTKVEMKSDLQDMLIEVLTNDDDKYFITAYYTFSDDYSSKFKNISCSHVDKEYQSDCKVLKDKIGEISENMGEAKRIMDKDSTKINSKEVNSILDEVNMDTTVLKTILAE